MLSPPRDLRGRVIVALTVGAIGEIGWTIYLGLGLPARYVAHHWVLAWVGLDVIEITMLLVTAYCASRRRRVFPIVAAVSGTLYCVDAWFDVTTASRTDVWRSLALAVFLEVPIALGLFYVAARALARQGASPAPPTQSETPSSESR
jgi:hypothetical protein